MEKFLNFLKNIQLIDSFDWCWYDNPSNESIIIFKKKTIFLFEKQKKGYWKMFIDKLEDWGDYLWFMS